MDNYLEYISIILSKFKYEKSLTLRIMIYLGYDSHLYLNEEEK